jgi:hypothetical protein
VLQILAAAVGLAVIGGLIGLLVGHFVGSGDAANGLGWGMVGVGAVVGFAAGGSGSPTENAYLGKVGAFGTYWGESAAPAEPAPSCAWRLPHVRGRCRRADPQLPVAG